MGKWGNGDTEVKLTTQEEIDYAMTLIKQAFDNVMESEKATNITFILSCSFHEVS